MSSQQKKIAILTITRYPVWAVPLAFLAMALFRIPLWLNRKLHFWKLMGSGKNGTFDKTPDLQQWALLSVTGEQLQESLLAAGSKGELLKCLYGKTLWGWVRLFCNQHHSYLLQPIECHGQWDGKAVFGELPVNSSYEGEIAVLTRATIRPGKLGRFWQHVPGAASEMANAPGFIKSYGIGEWPWIKQATFSIWSSKAAMREFAYKSHYHKAVIRKTHAEKWYSEEMFVRFRVVAKF